MEDDDVSLRPDTLAILQEFLKEKQIREQQESEKPSTDISEDWNLSQFWYEPSTSKFVAETIAKEIEGKKRVLFLSTPSIFKVVYQDEELSKQLDHHLFEFDKRFQVYAERFRFYDYRDPLGFPKKYRHSFDYICFDPPFLSQECIEKVAISIAALSHSNTKLLILTGRKQWVHIQKLFPTMHICKFTPEHPRLQNDFFCCSNYSSNLLGKEEIDDKNIN